MTARIVRQRARKHLTALAIVLVAALGAGCDAGRSTDQQGGEHADQGNTPATSAGTPRSTAESTPMSTPTPTVFDEAVVQDDVHQLLREEYEIDELDMVTCPADEAVEEGRTFSCTATIAGEEQDVPITVISDDGEYTVGRPE